MDMSSQRQHKREFGEENTQKFNMWERVLKQKFTKLNMIIKFMH